MTLMKPIHVLSRKSQRHSRQAGKQAETQLHTDKGPTEQKMAHQGRPNQAGHSRAGHIKESRAGEGQGADKGGCGLTCTDCGDEISPVDDGGDVGGAAVGQVQGHAGGACDGQARHLTKLRPLPHPEPHHNSLFWQLKYQQPFFVVLS